MVKSVDSGLNLMPGWGGWGPGNHPVSCLANLSTELLHMSLSDCDRTLPEGLHLRVSLQS